MLSGLPFGISDFPSRHSSNSYGFVLLFSSLENLTHFCCKCYETGTLKMSHRKKRSHVSDCQEKSLNKLSEVSNLFVEVIKDSCILQFTNFMRVRT